MAKKKLTEHGLSVVEAERRKKRVTLLIYITLAAATVVAYEPIRHNGFVGYDDTEYIVKNPHLTGGITQQSVTWAFTKSYASNWHPLTWISHILDCQFFGLNPLGHHLVSVLLHIANSLLLFWILTNITGAIWTSAFVAAVFAVHPVQVESVAWAAERKTVLSGLFWLLTMAAYVRYARQPAFGRYILVLLVFGLCIMTKPIVVTLPLVLLLLDYWPLERVRWGQSIGAASKSAKWLIVEKIPLLAMSAFLSVMTFVSQKSSGAMSTTENMPLDYRIANIFLSYIKYIGKMIWPSRLAVYHPHPRTGFSDVAVVICALLFVLITVFSIYMGRRKRYVTVGWLWYVGTLVPMIGLVQVGAQAIAYRYMYLSMLGLLIIVAWAVKDLVANRFHWEVVAAVSAIVVLSAFVILTRMQVRYWQNTITLFEHTLNVTKDNAAAEHNYGYALSEAGRLDEAAIHLNRAVQLVPIFVEARNNLGKLYLKQGKINEAIDCFTELAKRKDAPAEVHYNLASALLMQKRYDEAIKHLARVLELDPDYAHAPSAMAVALMSAGRTDEAIACFNKYLQLNENSAELHYNLAVAMVMQKNYDEAIKHFTRVTELDPNNAGALNGLARVLDTLAVTYAEAGKFDDAKITAEKALNIAKTAGQAELAREIDSRLQLYKKGLPYQGK
ncbi:MAG: tetratricopeptide repeat protein [Sedimentisphaerales bacterium]